MLGSPMEIPEGSQASESGEAYCVNVLIIGVKKNLSGPLRSPSEVISVGSQPSSGYGVGEIHVAKEIKRAQQNSWERKEKGVIAPATKT